jgi:hypothetical protein
MWWDSFDGESDDEKCSPLRENTDNVDEGPCLGGTLLTENETVKSREVHTLSVFHFICYMLGPYRQIIPYFKLSKRLLKEVLLSGRKQPYRKFIPSKYMPMICC